MRQLIKDRIYGLIKTCLKPSFLTWVFIVFVKLKGNQELNLDFYLFTAAIIGMSKYFNSKKQGVI
jgi:hypothetical protein